MQTTLLKKRIKQKPPNGGREEVKKMTNKEIRELLGKQLELLSERAQKADSDMELAMITSEIRKLAELLLGCAA